MAFSNSLLSHAEALEAELQAILAGAAERGWPVRLTAAMGHGLLGGGKRFRPFLVIESAALFDIERADALPAAAALECVHCYSLVHDDLPAMDNDELRRGQPSVWKAYGDWAAILAGDALLTFAFEILTRSDWSVDTDTRVALIAALAQAAGAGGMAGGQQLDLEAERHRDGCSVDVAGIVRLQGMKTGALLRFGCEAGAILGHAPADLRRALIDYGAALGLAFQISDDLLDVEGDAATVGKRVGKDAAAGKASFVTLLGPAAAREELAATIASACRALSPFGSKADILIDAACYLGRRRS